MLDVLQTYNIARHQKGFRKQNDTVFVSMFVKGETFFNKIYKKKVLYIQNRLGIRPQHGNSLYKRL